MRIPVAARDIPVDRLPDIDLTSHRTLALLTALGVLLVISTRASWMVLRHVVTIAHEGGHALVALLAGRRLSGIRLHSDTSGVTVSRGRPRGVGMILTVAAGYPAPALLGLGFAALVARGHVVALLWLAVALLLGTLLLIRNVFGVMSVVTTGAVVFALSWYAEARVKEVFAYAATWFLLVGGLRTVGELQRERRRRGARHGRAQSDADQLARLTGLPGLLWVGAFAVVSVASLLVSARWLVAL